jgi:hypothetical protein
VARQPSRGVVDPATSGSDRGIDRGASETHDVLTWSGSCANLKADRVVVVVHLSKFNAVTLDMRADDFVACDNGVSRVVTKTTAQFRGGHNMAVSVGRPVQVTRQW